MSSDQQSSLSVLSGARDRLDNIDALRAFAVIAVILFHYTARYPLQYTFYSQPVWRATYGYMGVELFFIISGYCIYMTAAHCPGLALFWARRISRLQVAYMAAILMTLVVVANYGLPGREVGGLAALGNLVWLNAIDLVRSVDGVYWSLIVELKLYLLFGLIFFGLRGRGDPLLWWTVLCALGAGIYHYDRMMAGGAISSATYMLATFVTPHSGFFLIGMLLYRWQSTPHWLKLLAVVVFAGASCHAFGRNWVEYALLFALFPLSKIVLDWKSLWIPRPIVFVGFISYPLYLVHNNIGIVLIRQTAWDIPSEYARIALAIALSLLLAAIISFTVEHRFRKAVERPIEWFFALIIGLPSRLRSAPAAPVAGAAASTPDRA